MRGEEGATNAASLLRAMANPTRIEIISALSAGELSVFALRSQVLLSQSALSQHLAKLRAHDLVATRKSGQVVYYRIKDKDVAQLAASLKLMLSKRGPA